MTNYKGLICQLMSKFYTLGWCSGTGGGISIFDKNENTIYMAPSGVQKELLHPDDIFELNRDGSIKNQVDGLKLSECAPLFQLAFNMRRAGAVIHSHAMEALLITRKFKKEFVITNLEMIKGIRGHKNTDNLIVPIIENTENESELTHRLKMAILAYPKTYAVLVRNHGVYVWGESWEKAKQYAECYHYLFSASLKISQLSLSENNDNNNNICPRIWYMNKEIEHDIDQQDINRDWERPLLQLSDIEKLGIFYQSLSGDENDPQLLDIKKQYNYNFQDIVTVSKETLKDKYQSLTKKFFEEHFHNDDEVRYIIDGSGYFDIKDQNNEWIRIQMTKGDLINLPAGCYHRFTTDKNDYIVAIRLFSGEPVWEAILPNDNSIVRQTYVKNITNKY